MDTQQDPQATEPGGDQLDPGADPGDQLDPEAQPGGQDPQPAETQAETVSIDRYTRATNRASYLERENYNLRQQLQQGQGQPPAAEAPAAETAKPMPADFDTDAEYYEALSDWKFDQREAERTAARAKETVQQRENGVNTRIDQVINSEMAKDPSFQDKAFIPEGLLKDIEVAEMLVNSDQFVRIALHLGENPQLAQQMAHMTPRAQALEIGRLEMQIKNSIPPQRTTTRAPTTTEIVGGGEAATEFDPETASMAEYRKWRQGGGGKS